MNFFCIPCFFSYKFLWNAFKVIGVIKIKQQISNKTSQIWLKFKQHRQAISFLGCLYTELSVFMKYILLSITSIYQETLGQTGTNVLLRRAESESISVPCFELTRLISSPRSSGPHQPHLLWWRLNPEAASLSSLLYPQSCLISWGRHHYQEHLRLRRCDQQHWLKFSSVYLFI